MNAIQPDQAVCIRQCQPSVLHALTMLSPYMYLTCFCAGVQGDGNGLLLPGPSSTSTSAKWGSASSFMLRRKQQQQQSQLQQQQQQSVTGSHGASCAHQVHPHQQTHGYLAAGTAPAGGHHGERPAFSEIIPLNSNLLPSMPNPATSCGRQPWQHHQQQQPRGLPAPQQPEQHMQQQWHAQPCITSSKLQPCGQPQLPNQDSAIPAAAAPPPSLHVLPHAAACMPPTSSSAPVHLRRPVLLSRSHPNKAFKPPFKKQQQQQDPQQKEQ
jgi:hypothetical protein